MIQLSYYVFCVYALLFLDEKRKDFSAMLIHHCVTIMLIVFSYAVRQWKIGLLTMFVHDICDLFLDASKFLYNLKQDKDGNVYSKFDKCATIIAILFPFSWFDNDRCTYLHAEKRFLFYIHILRILWSSYNISSRLLLVF
ncbi:ceramide synthase 1-like protein, partial [Dinothrombium tinctorium]